MKAHCQPQAVDRTEILHRQLYETPATTARKAVGRVHLAQVKLHSRGKLLPGFLGIGDASYQSVQEVLQDNLHACLLRS